MNVLNNQDADKILTEMYIKGMDTYGFSFDTSKGDDKLELVGYNEILDNIFTQNGKEQFEDYYKNVLVKENKKVYLTDSSLVKDSLNYAVNIISKDIKEDEIVSKVKITYNDVEKEESTFAIKKIDNMWKVDNFTCPF